MRIYSTLVLSSTTLNTGLIVPVLCFQHVFPKYPTDLFSFSTLPSVDDVTSFDIRNGNTPNMYKACKGPDAKYQESKNDMNFKS